VKVDRDFAKHISFGFWTNHLPGPALTATLTVAWKARRGTPNDRSANCGILNGDSPGIFEHVSSNAALCGRHFIDKDQLMLVDEGRFPFAEIG
jgi:hypothetical protein